MKVRVHGRTKHYRTVSFDIRTNEVVLIEQRRLPHAFELTRTGTYKQTARAIANMTLRHTRSSDRCSPGLPKESFRASLRQ